MKIAIYTVLFGPYDQWREPKYVQPDADYFVFTDQDIKSDTYEVVKYFKGLLTKPRAKILRAREFKIFIGYGFLCKEGYDLIIYHDANIIQTKDLQPLIDMQVNDLMILRHPVRDCIYDEFHACADGNKDKVKTMYKQVQRYADLGYPENNGLVASGVMFRRNSKKVAAFCRAWYKEVSKGSIRDQLSFDYVAWKLKYKFDMMDWQYIYDYFDYNSKHKN